MVQWKQEHYTGNEKIWEGEWSMYIDGVVKMYLQYYMDRWKTVKLFKKIVIEIDSLLC